MLKYCPWLLPFVLGHIYMFVLWTLEAFGISCYRLHSDPIFSQLSPGSTQPSTSQLSSQLPCELGALCFIYLFLQDMLVSAVVKLLLKEPKPQKENKGKELSVYLAVCFTSGKFPSLLPAEEVCSIWGKHCILHKWLMFKCKSGIYNAIVLSVSVLCHGLGRS